MKYINREKVVKYIKEDITDRKFKYITFFWIIIATQFVIGSNLQTKGYSIRNITELIIALGKIIGLSILFIIIHYCILELYKKVKEKTQNKNYKESTKWIEKYKFEIYFIIIIACWIPTLMAFYPCIINYDGGFQIRDYFFFKKINLGHPIITTFFYTIFYTYGVNSLNSPTLGMLLFSLFQMTLMAAIFAYAVKFIEKETNKKYLRNISLIIYSLFPYNQLFPMMTTKDVVFAGFTLLFIINLYKMFYKKYKVLNYISLIFITVMMLLFRNNAVYALIVLIPFAIIILIKNKKQLKNFLVIILISVIIYQLINNLLFKLIHEESNGSDVWACTFAQATGKIASEKELTDTEKEKISLYFTNYEVIGKIYKPYIADYTMQLIKIDEIRKDKKEFFKFMAELAKKYPREFIESYLNTIRGYWYILDKSFSSEHNEDCPEKYGALELYCFKIGKNRYEVKDESKLPKLKEFYSRMFCENEYQNIYGIRILFQPATYFYILLACLLYSIYKKQKIEILIEMYLFLYFLTCFLSPGAIIRYIYAIIVCIPVIVSIKKQNNKSEEEQ